MKYDFTTVLDRHGKDAIAVDFPPGQPKDGFDLIPMWVADMNFPACPTIPERLFDYRLGVEILEHHKRPLFNLI